MNQLLDFSTILDQLSFISDFYHAHAQIVLSVALIFALLNCFFGYALRKVWCSMFGLLLGVGTGLAVCTYLNLPVQVALLAAAGLGLLFALLAFFLYRIGIFFLCIGIVTFLLFWLYPTPTLNTLIGFLVLAIVIGFLAVIREHLVVVCITAICGGIATAQIFNMMLVTPLSSFVFWLIAVGLSALGLFLQFKPWRGREYWEHEADKNSRNRERARKHRKQHSGGRKKSSSFFSRKKKKRRKSSASERKQTNYSQPANRRQSSSYEKPAVSSKKAHPSSANQNTQTAASGSESAKQRPYSENPAAVSGHNAYPADIQRTSVQPPSPDSAQADNYTVDLSDIRSELSREVQDIYKDN